MIGLGRKDEYSGFLHAFLLVPLEMCRQHGYSAWVAKSASWYMNGFLNMQHLVCVNGLIFPNFPKFEPKLDEMYTWILNKFIFEQNYGLS